MSYHSSSSTYSIGCPLQARSTRLRHAGFWGSTPRSFVADVHPPLSITVAVSALNSNIGWGEIIFFNEQDSSSWHTLSTWFYSYWKLIVVYANVVANIICLLFHPTWHIKALHLKMHRQSAASTQTPSKLVSTPAHHTAWQTIPISSRIWSLLLSNRV